MLKISRNVLLIWKPFRDTSFSQRTIKWVFCFNCKTHSFFRTFPLILLQQRVFQETNWWNIPQLFLNYRNKIHFSFSSKLIWLLPCDQTLLKIRQNLPKKIPIKNFENLPGHLKLLYFLPHITGHVCLVSQSGVRALEFASIPRNIMICVSYKSVPVSARGQVEHQKWTQTPPPLPNAIGFGFGVQLASLERTCGVTKSSRTDSYLNGNGFMYACMYERLYVCFCVCKLARSESLSSSINPIGVNPRLTVLCNQMS